MARRIGLLPGVLNQHLKTLYQPGTKRSGVLSLQHAIDDLPINGSAEQAQCLLERFHADLQTVARAFGARL